MLLAASSQCHFGAFHGQDKHNLDFILLHHSWSSRDQEWYSWYSWYPIKSHHKCVHKLCLFWCLYQHYFENNFIFKYSYILIMPVRSKNINLLFILFNGLCLKIKGHTQVLHTNLTLPIDYRTTLPTWHCQPWMNMTAVQTNEETHFP